MLESSAKADVELSALADLPAICMNYTGNYIFFPARSIPNPTKINVRVQTIDISLPPPEMKPNQVT